MTESSCGYAAIWERTALTRDGAPFRIRPIRFDDAPLERSFVQGLSEESRYWRTMGTMSKQLIADPGYRLVKVDYRDNMAFAALVGGGVEERIIGIAQYAQNRERDHEFAIAIADEWQARGVGSAIMLVLFDYARCHGIDMLHGDILSENHRMIEFVRWLGMTNQRAVEDPTLIKACCTLSNTPPADLAEAR